MANSFQVSFRDYSGKGFEYKSVSEIKDFLQNEIDFLEENAPGGTLPPPFINAKKSLPMILQKVNDFEAKIDTLESVQYINLLQVIQNEMNNLDRQWLWSGHPYVINFIENCKLSPNTGLAFLMAILQKRLLDINQYDNLKGAILAYEYQMQNKSDIVTRRLGEEKTFENFINRLDDKTNDLIKKTDKYEKTWENTQVEIIDYNKKFKRVNAKLLQRTQKKRDNEFNTYMENTKNEFEDYIEKQKNRAQELENTYQELLRLKKPADYWNQRAKTYQTQGNWHFLILTILLLGGMCIFGHYFTQWLYAKELKLALNNLEGVVIFGTMITIYIFMIRSFAKLAFSSFHLKRDAEEREQLTYVYLSLMNEGAEIAKENQSIILQALFSRVDTGLLAQDSSPTMPTMEILKSLKQ
ncbi:MAG: DUF6161 domain-containing protein [Sulfurospirillaceae bacterium]|nr:DUF6161 domain-containing protein [Sulfurospirillaceae bacterium]